LKKRTKKLLPITRRATIAALRGFFLFFAVIFIPAWTLGYWQGWAFFLTLAICTSLATIYIARRDTKLLESRLNMGPTAETCRGAFRRTAETKAVPSLKKTAKTSLHAPLWPEQHRCGRPIFRSCGTPGI
jgi:hypothetical protein